MSPQTAQPDALMGWMQSLADPIRLRLMRLLERHELGVVELCDVLQLPQSTVSRHLKVLADEGWLRSQRRGTTNLYRATLADAGSRRLWVLAREQTERWPAVGQDRLRLARRLSARRQQSQAFFAGAAANWDKLRAELYGTAFNSAAMLALLPSDWVVADLGCGTGQTTAALAPHVARVIGIDNSPAMLRAARRRSQGLDNVELRAGDLEALPIESASCDAVLMLLALVYVHDPAAVLREASRILRPGGRLVVVDLLPHDREDFLREYNQQHPGFDPASLGQVMVSAGITPGPSQPLESQPHAKGPALFLMTGRRGASAPADKHTNGNSN